MAEDAGLVELSRGGGNEIIVLVHGFNAINGDDQWNTLVAQIARAKLWGTVYLMYWSSGSPWGGWHDEEHTATSTLPVIDLPTMLGRAEHHGRRLKRHLGQVPGIKATTVHLIGHSLGARLIHWALASSDWRDYRLGDVVLLGGAANAADDDWEECARAINGRIYNAWSSEDRVLLPVSLASAMTFGATLDPCGRRPIDAVGVTDVELSLGHNDYWPRLASVLRRVWPRYRRHRPTGRGQQRR